MGETCETRTNGPDGSPLSESHLRNSYNAVSPLGLLVLPYVVQGELRARFHQEQRLCEFEEQNIVWTAGRKLK